MIIKTYCLDIHLKDYEFLDFNLEKSMISFSDGDTALELYFRCSSWAMDFYFELIEAIYENKETADLTHYQVLYSTLFLPDVTRLISERIK